MKGLSAVIAFSSITGLTTAAGSNGCGKPLPKHQSAGGDSHQTHFTTSDGTERTYLIHIPSNYDTNTPVPLIFSFHGRSGNSANQEGLSQFSNEDWNPNGIAVYPQGLDEQWQGDPASEGVDDIAFTLEMLDHFEDRYCIDSSRIYAAGKSNGGGFTHLLACDSTASTRIAAFAPVAGAYYQEVSEDDCNPITVPIECNPGRSPIPIIEFHGFEDETIPYAGGPRRGECLPSVPHFVREWSKRDGFGLHNKTTNLYDHQVQRYEYASGDAFGTVTHYRIGGLGHDWPSTGPNSDNPDGTYLDATPLIMDFFNRWAL
ncbi:putative ferulic acid esterase [Aspergillus steynii IBT 23096]|uniref:feruloyl esterase n=1 Tax=Aspergillus steynii IBT 23096 TaxID=1392250 RepID=A0A2I2GNS7_9EURO|nr:putative ferulic acid esterase [Aspergillus steynii IBT 23096]PLB54532.1 putative ferulic acid esterase [Aspergillus steynii IBT 23096]